ncbi:cytochrome P450 [Dermabacteraceae bacterium TAE3-ERU5]|nr:cytochrome P450 [Dermabacteraceae bacterium TAE3-ERU5]
MAIVKRWIDAHILNRIAINTWRTDFRVNEEYVNISSNFAIIDILANKTNLLRHESGFFRLEYTPLPEDVIKEASKRVLEIFSTRANNQQSRAREVLDRHSNISPSRNFGHRLIRDFHREQIAGSWRSDSLQSAIDFYVQKSVIRDDIKRVASNPYKHLNEARHLFRKALATEAPSHSNLDLVDLAISLTPSPEERAELFQRLVLATTGFLGASLEWLLLDAHRHKSLHRETASELFVRESLRLSSPACRLARTFVERSSIGNIEVSPGDTALLNVKQGNRDPKTWNNPDTFMPSRWLSQTPSKVDLTFGKGRGICPARNPSIETLSAFSESLKEDLYIEFWKVPGSSPLVGTLLTPPRGIFVKRSLKT